MNFDILQLPYSGITTHSLVVLFSFFKKIHFLKSFVRSLEDLDIF